MARRGSAGPEERAPSADDSSRSVAWVSVKNASALLGVSAQTLRRWDKTGVLPAQRHPANNYRVYDEARLRAWVEETSRPDAAPREAALGRAVREGELVGRLDVLATLDAHLESGKCLVVVVGAPGVGKTRMVRAWMDRLEGRRSTSFAALGACRSVEALVGALSLSLSLSPRGHTADTRVVELERALRERPGHVLVLDELENLDDAALCVIGRLAATGVIVVATSRIRPRLANEHIVALAPLEFPADDSPASARTSTAVALFLERAKDAGGLAVIDDEVLSHAAAIVRRLEGLPLALELAASRTASLGLARLRREIDLSIEAVGAGAIDVLPHHRTLRAAVSSSIERLDAQTLALLEAAAILPQDFELEELEALISASELGADAVLDGLRTLVDHSMVSARQDGRSSASLCFAIHAVVREIVLERTVPERRALLELRHAEWRAREGRRLSEDRSTAASMRIARAEPGLRRAWRWTMEHRDRPGAAELAADLACTLGRSIETYGPSPGVVEILERTAELARAAGVDRARRAALAFHRGLARLERSEVDGAGALYEEARELASGGTSPRFEAMAFTQLGWIAGRHGRLADADELLDAAERANVGRGDPWPEMVGAGIRGQLDLRRGRLTAARRGFERARAIAIRVGDGANEASSSGFLGSVAYDEGALREAVRHYDRAIALSASQQASMLEAIFRGYRATALHELGDPTAMTAYDEALVCTRRAHTARFEALFTSWRAVLLAQRGELDAAAAAMDAADAMVDWDSARAIVSLHRGHLDLARGEIALRGEIDEGAPQRAVALGCRRLAAISLEGEGMLRELRVAHRFLERALLASLPEHAPARAVTIGWQGGWIERDGERTALQKHKPLRRLTWELALRRITEPGIAADVGSLVAAAWPSERLREDSATHRLRVALSTLRQLGLRDVLQGEDGRYRLDPSCDIRLAGSRAG